jgi:hypothetical protein
VTVKWPREQSCRCRRVLRCRCERAWWERARSCDPAALLRLKLGRQSKFPTANKAPSAPDNLMKTARCSSC